MEPHELTLSDVHLGADYETIRKSPLNNYDVVLSRFPFSSQCEKLEPCDSVTVDEDGDLVVPRSLCQHFTDLIYIEHTLSTRLVDVGLQVWQGCLLLCDYIMDNLDLVRDCIVLELGSGVGLASITAALASKTVFCTDIGDDVLKMCTQNAERNKALFELNTEKEHQNVIRVRELDWTQENLPKDEKHSNYYWTPKDLDLFQEVEVILAADVIYDNDLTDAFFKTVRRIMSSKPPKVLITALERRLNFTIEDMEVSCPAYNHFMSSLTELCKIYEGQKVHFTCERLNTSFPQYFQYHRTQYLELWRLSARFNTKEESPELLTGEG